LGNNCRGAEKLSRLKELLGGWDGYQIYAYGNSAGDREMLQAADFPFYRCFGTQDDQDGILL
jgi:phosphoserine phosphatase